METTLRPYSPSQILLLPPDLGEWLPEGHLVYYVSDIVDALEKHAAQGVRNTLRSAPASQPALVAAYIRG